MHIYNLILSSGVFHDEMKLAKVTAIHKGGSFDKINYHRPISVLPVFSKMAEHIINRRITGFLAVNNIIAKEQYGFCKNKSAETALLKIKEYITDNIEHKIYTPGIFLDFRKAFDSIQHDLLSRKLPYYGIRGTTVQLIQSYLSSRKQYTNVNNIRSQLEFIKYGVLQASIF